MQRWQDRLLAWFAEAGRALPWRTTRDPYRILVSEVMAQQTQLARVVPGYHRFLELFPTVPALAAAPAAEVLRAWAGLGYNRRARYLHDAARVILDQHAGLVPRDQGALRALPGVGDYTARAILAFAFDRDAAPVDTNIARVLQRVSGRQQRRRELQTYADGLVPTGRASAWSSALMDLGAIHCRAQPRCDDCPLTPDCAWFSSGGVDPAAPPRRQAAFAGSDRFHRGRLLAALRTTSLPTVAVAEAARLDDDHGRARAIAEGLVRDGLAEWVDGTLRLPG